MSKITNVVTLSEYAKRHGYDVKRLRRYARKSEFPGDVQPFKFGDTNGRGGVWAIDANAPAVELPAKSARGTRRADGRQRYIAFMNDGEYNAVTAMDIEIIDPRVASKIRRDARKLADMENAVVELTGDDVNG